MIQKCGWPIGEFFKKLTFRHVWVNEANKFQTAKFRPDFIFEAFSSNSNPGFRGRVASSCQIINFFHIQRQ
jgi:hypothetical protein